MNGIQKCVICGNELDIHMTQLVLITREGGCESACCFHEGSQELKQYVESKGGAITFSEYDRLMKEGKLCQSS